jgi:tRNA threonylcarbamoyladenosine biosynthesis protein TsaE
MSGDVVFEQTSELAGLAQIASRIIAESAERQVLLLYGPMGVGKTAFVRALVAEKAWLGHSPTEATTSPSFAIHNHYDVGSSIDHLDLYRIESEDELESTGFYDLFSQPAGLILIEWAERLDAQHLPLSWTKMKLSIEFTDQADKRKFILSKPAALAKA